uniref:Ig-like domain-containing protein n=1 Tax=Macrostomum lignano TaxID=282301 RepID=A0A1I8HZN5_9PLAT
MYTCRAENAAGVTEFAATIYVRSPTETDYSSYPLSLPAGAASAVVFHAGGISTIEAADCAVRSAVSADFDDVTLCENLVSCAWGRAPVLAGSHVMFAAQPSLGRLLALQTSRWLTFEPVQLNCPPSLMAYRQQTDQLWVACGTGGIFVVDSASAFSTNVDVGLSRRRTARRWRFNDVDSVKAEKFRRVLRLPDSRSTVLVALIDDVNDVEVVVIDVGDYRQQLEVDGGSMVLARVGLPRTVSVDTADLLVQGGTLLLHKSTVNKSSATLGQSEPTIIAIDLRTGARVERHLFPQVYARPNDEEGIAAVAPTGRIFVSNDQRHVMHISGSNVYVYEVFPTGELSLTLHDVAGVAIRSAQFQATPDGGLKILARTERDGAVLVVDLKAHVFQLVFDEKLDNKPSVSAPEFGNLALVHSHDSAVFFNTTSLAVTECSESLFVGLQSTPSPPKCESTCRLNRLTPESPPPTPSATSRKRDSAFHHRRRSKSPDYQQQCRCLQIEAPAVAAAAVESKATRTRPAGRRSTSEEVEELLDDYASRRRRSSDYRPRRQRCRPAGATSGSSGWRCRSSWTGWMSTQELPEADSNRLRHLLQLPLSPIGWHQRLRRTSQALSEQQFLQQPALSPSQIPSHRQTGSQSPASSSGVASFAVDSQPRLGQSFRRFAQQRRGFARSALPGSGAHFCACTFSGFISDLQLIESSGELLVGPGQAVVAFKTAADARHDSSDVESRRRSRGVSPAFNQQQNLVAGAANAEHFSRFAGCHSVVDNLVAMTTRGCYDVTGRRPDQAAHLIGRQSLIVVVGLADHPGYCAAAYGDTDQHGHASGCTSSSGLSGSALGSSSSSPMTVSPGKANLKLPIIIRWAPRSAAVCRSFLPFSTMPNWPLDITWRMTRLARAAEAADTASTHAVDVQQTKRTDCPRSRLRLHQQAPTIAAMPPDPNRPGSFGRISGSLSSSLAPPCSSVLLIDSYPTMQLWIGAKWSSHVQQVPAKLLAKVSTVDQVESSDAHIDQGDQTRAAAGADGTAPMRQRLLKQFNGLQWIIDKTTILPALDGQLYTLKDTTKGSNIPEARNSNRAPFSVSADPHNAGKRWSQWADRFEDFIDASGITNEKQKLRTAAEPCDFEQLKDSLIRDQLVATCSSDKLRRRLLQEANISLEEALRKARAFEAAEEQATEMEKTDSHVASVARATRRGPAQTTSRPGDQQQRTCYRCGEKGHATCDAAKGKICHNCGKPNHLALACRQPRQSNSSRIPQQQISTNAVFTAADGSVNEDVFALYNRDKYPSDVSLTVQVANRQLPMMIDSGASCSIMSLGTFRALSLPSPRPTRAEVRAYGVPTPLRIVGTADLDIQVGSARTTATFHIMDGDGLTILGRQPAFKLGVLKIQRPEATKPQNINAIADTTPSEQCSDPQLKAILQRHKEVFNGIGCIKGVEVQIQLSDDAVPVCQAPSRVAAHLKEAVVDELKALEEQGIIEAVKGPSAWVSRMVVVPKDDGGVRICQDLRDLNAFVIPEKQQIPTLDEITEEMADAKLFSELDIRKAFYQIPVHESSRHLFTFSTPLGLMRLKRLSMGFTNASEILQRVMLGILSGIDGVRWAHDDVVPLPERRRNVGEELDAAFINAVSTGAVPKGFSLDQVREASRTDRDVQAALNAIRTGRWDMRAAAQRSFKSISGELSESDGVLLRGDLIVIPESLRRPILQLAHTGHLGADRTLKRLQTKVWWPRMRSDCELFVQCCTLCQAAATGLRQTPLRPTDIPDGAWLLLGMDFYGPVQGQMLLVTTDLYSKYPEVNFLNSTTAESVIPHLRRLFGRYGVPIEVVTDNGPPFSSAAFRSFLASYGIHHRLICPLHPESNGATERVNRSIGKVIQTAVAEGRNWRRLSRTGCWRSARHHIERPAAHLLSYSWAGR